MAATPSSDRSRQPAPPAGEQKPGTLPPPGVETTVDFPNSQALPLPIPSVADPALPSIAGYEILGILGRGGMGVVYKARHLALKRVVALKMIVAGVHAEPKQIARFLVEAQAVARLQHPNIVQIHEIGQQDGLPFFSLEFVPGGSLDKHLAGTPQNPKDAAHLVLILAQAMQAAHQAGIIHRDLKPANVLLASGGRPPPGNVNEPGGSRPPLADLTPKITDFGLAKQLDSSLAQTYTGAIMGTPSYMAPEQAAGNVQAIGPAADVYALGAILYEMLTGRAPFKAPTPLETVMQVIADEPVPPSQLQPKVPRDLETICLKCLQKEPGKRYPSAGDLADDLGRFSRGEPIRARPVGSLGRVWRWCRRNPVVASLLMAVIFSLFLGTAVAWLFALKAEASAEQANQDKIKAFTSEQKAKDNEEFAKDQTKIAKEQTKLAQEETAEKEKALTKAEWLVYAGNINLAQSEWENNNTAAALHWLQQSPEKFRGWEYRYLSHLFSRHRQTTLRGHRGTVPSVAFSPDGKQLASAGSDRMVKVWDAATGQETLTLRGHTIGVMSVAFSPDGKRLASASFDGMVKVWDAATGLEILTLRGHSGPVQSVAFSPDGKRLASASWDKTVKVWDVATGQETLTLRGHTDRVFSVAFSPDGKLLASASVDRMVKVWDAATGQETLTFRGHTSPVMSVAFCPDGNRLASAGFDRMVKVWDAATGQEILTLRGHTGPVHSVAFSPDGKRLASASLDDTVKVWDAATGQEAFTLRGHTNPVLSVAFNPDGKRLASASEDGTVKVWDAATGQESLTRRHTDRVYRVAFSPDGKRLASTGANTIEVWNAATGQETPTFRGDTSGVSCVAFSPDGKRLASASGKFNKPGEVKVWDAATGQETLTLRGHTKGITSVAFSPDGKRLASASLDRTVKVWDVATGQETLTLRGHTDSVQMVAFSPDGKRLASASADKTMKLWDPATGQESLTLRGHTSLVWSVAFSPDGKRLASASFDKTVKVWDVATGQETLTLRGHTDRVFSVAFSPDGKRLASASDDKTVKVWEALAESDDSTFQVPKAPVAPPPVKVNIPPPPPLSKGKPLLNVRGNLAASDPHDPRKKGCHHKIYQIDLSAGKTYIIEMNKTPGSQLDSYLRVETLAGQTLAEDDDSGGNLNARVTFKAPASAKYRIVATSCVPGMTGNFTLSYGEVVTPPVKD